MTCVTELGGIEGQVAPLTVQVLKNWSEHPEVLRTKWRNLMGLADHGPVFRTPRDTCQTREAPGTPPKRLATMNVPIAIGDKLTGIGVACWAVQPDLLFFPGPAEGHIRAQTRITQGTPCRYQKGREGRVGTGTGKLTLIVMNHFCHEDFGTVLCTVPLGK